MMPENKNSQLAGPFLKTPLQHSRNFMTLIRSFSTVTGEKQNTVTSTQEKKNKSVIWNCYRWWSSCSSKSWSLYVIFSVKSEQSWLTKWSSWALLSRIVEMSAEQLCSFTAGHRESSRLSSQHQAGAIIIAITHSVGKCLEPGYAVLGVSDKLRCNCWEKYLGFLKELYSFSNICILDHKYEKSHTDNFYKVQLMKN